MNIKEYATEILTVLKKDKKLKHLMETVAEDSDLAPAKDTIQDIRERMVQERIVELTEEYFWKVDFTEKKEKGKKKWFSFARGAGSPDTVTRGQRREKKKRENEAKKAAAGAGKRIREEAERVQRKQQLEAELKSLKEKEDE